MSTNIDDSRGDKTASRRENNRLAQQRFREKAKRREPELERETATAHEEIAALLKEQQDLCQERDAVDQTLKSATILRGRLSNAMVEDEWGRVCALATDVSLTIDLIKRHKQTGVTLSPPDPRDTHRKN
ncbi:uncharacterized protein LMH87_007657 [Akanthomyces muscarius]|uniref:BZIP domain-containing protein n=1 Tax=Akanthomyces muscarius TaxID=2231603 RepID=A0A9W8QJJ9_AKAMU|nr:uncharacterized protein LMH87_007657 [Akanthomyces muscarius]KAJ4161629.1 hypothetical protein LMH87_007657 [Akanthomyces muscarius]